MSGHAIEVRLCAEDPAKGFLPSVGRIVHFGFPNRADATIGRLETGVRQGDSVSPYYDSMIAKLIVHADNRWTVIHWLSEKLACMHVAGIKTNGRFLQQLLYLNEFTGENMDTGTIARHLDKLTESRITEADLAAAVAGVLGASDIDGDAPWCAKDAFQLGGSRSMNVPLVVDGNLEQFSVVWPPGRRIAVSRNRGGAPLSLPEQPATEHPVKVYRDGRSAFALTGLHEQIHLEYPTYDSSSIDDGAASDTIRAPINGRVARVFVSEGEGVEKGQRIAVVEAMKMEHVLTAPREGTIAKISTREGAQVNQGTVLVALAEV